MAFSEIMTELIDRSELMNENVEFVDDYDWLSYNLLLNSICYTDKCKFQISQGPNRQQQRYRSREKPTEVFNINRQ